MTPPDLLLPNWSKRAQCGLCVRSPRASSALSSWPPPASLRSRAACSPAGTWFQAALPSPPRRSGLGSIGRMQPSPTPIPTRVPTSPPPCAPPQFGFGRRVRGHQRCPGRLSALLMRLPHRRTVRAGHVVEPQRFRHARASDRQRRQPLQLHQRNRGAEPGWLLHHHPWPRLAAGQLASHQRRGPPRRSVHNSRSRKWPVVATARRAP